MSLKMAGDGHLDILLLYEQHHPQLVRGHVEFTLCYDIIFRYYGDSPLSYLHILSQHGVDDPSRTGQLVFKLIPYPETRNADWIFQENRVISQEEATCSIAFPSPVAGLEPVHYITTHLRPVIGVPACVQRPECAKAMAAFWTTGLTFALVSFEGSQQIKPYDPDRPGTTTYWLRLCVRPKMNFDITPAMTFGPVNAPLLAVQPCSILGPQTILDNLDDELECLARNSRVQEGAHHARELLFQQCFYRDRTGAAVRDHRISLTTDRQFLVLNPHFDGPCGFTGVEPVSTAENTIARTWIAGSDHYWAADPFGMAVQVYLYLKEWAFNKGEAKTKEQVSTAVSPDDHYNVCYVVEALTKLGYIMEPEVGCAHYCVNKEKTAEALAILGRGSSTCTKLMRTKYISILDALYGRLPTPAQKDGYERFKPKGFRIQFDLAFVPGQGEVV